MPGTATAAATSAIRIIRFIIRTPIDAGTWLSNVQLEDLPGVVFEDHFLVGRAQKLEALDQVARLIQPLSGLRIFDRSDARPLGSAQTTIDADGLEEQFQRLSRVQN